MFGTTTFYDLIRNTTVQEILQGCKTNLDSFQKIRENYLIYPDYWDKSIFDRLYKKHNKKNII